MKNEQEDHIIQLLTRYLQNEVQEDEREFVDNWVRESTDNQAYFDEIKKIWDNAETIKEFDKINIDDQWNRFKETTDIEEEKPKSFNTFYLKIAASLVILLGLTFYLNTFFKGEVTLVADAENIFILPDNSKVWLNEGSELTYKKNFKGDTRQLNLDGEGYFEVTKNPEKPFIVITNKTETKVLGTAFNLKGNSDSEQTELVLVEGSVEFSSVTQKEILTPGEKVVAKANGEIIKTENQDPNFMSWKSGVLLFEETTMKDVITAINEYYKTQIIMQDDQVSNCVLTTQFDNETLEEVLETLKVLFGISYHKDTAGSYIIKGGGCLSF